MSISSIPYTALPVPPSSIERPTVQPYTRKEILDFIATPMYDPDTRPRVDIARMRATPKDILNEREHDTGATPLILAIFAGNLHMFTVLIEAGVDLNARDNQGRTALINAIDMIQLEFCRRLIVAGADILVKDMFHHTAIQYAQTRYLGLARVNPLDPKAQDTAAIFQLLKTPIDRDWETYL